MTGPWRLLPEGIRFDPLTMSGPAANFVDIGARHSTGSALPPTVQFRGSAINVSTDVAYQVFAPDGTLRKARPDPPSACRGR